MKYLLILGIVIAVIWWFKRGPRIDNKLARSLGFDAGFGPGTTPGQVAAFLVNEVTAREARGAQPKA